MTVNLSASRKAVVGLEGLETAAELSAASGANTRVINVSDRESDLWELFERQWECRDEVGVLVRYNGSRQRKVIDADGKAVDLRKHVEGLKKVVTRV